MSAQVVLVPGYTLPQGRAAVYRGVLRRKRGSTVPVWKCVHDHLTLEKARDCAAAELARTWWWRGAVRPVGSPS